MTISKLIQQLQQLADKHGDDVEVYKAGINPCNGRCIYSPVIQVYCSLEAHPGEASIIISSSAIK